MNYQISSQYGKYKSVIFPELGKIIVGVPKDDDEMDVSAALDKPALSYLNIPHFWDRYFRLPTENRIVIDRLMTYLDDTGKCQIHMGKNWEAILYFLHARYQATLSDLAKCALGTCQARGYLDTLEKMKKRTTFGNIASRSRYNLSTSEIARLFCAFNLISPDFVEKGIGYLYELKKDSLTDVELGQIHDKLFKRTAVEERVKLQDFDLERYLFDELNLRDKMKKWTIQNLYISVFTSKESADMVSKLLEFLQVQ